jgi:hypothetical protein
VLQRLREVHLKLNPSKCCFGAQSITFLVHVVSIEGSHLNPKKIAMIKKIPILKFVTNVRAFLGFISSYRKFIPRYAKIIEPLFGFIKKDDKFLWTPIYQGGFITLKK